MAAEKWDVDVTESTSVPTCSLQASVGGNTCGTSSSAHWLPRGETETAPSVITIVELTHGINRAKSEADRERRRAFVEELSQAIPVHPVSLEIAQLAGRIEGEQDAEGIVIALPDVLIGVTALHLGYSVATLNSRHFQSIPGLSVVRL